MAERRSSRLRRSGRGDGSARSLEEWLHEVDRDREDRGRVPIAADLRESLQIA